MLTGYPPYTGSSLSAVVAASMSTAEYLKPMASAQRLMMTPSQPKSDDSVISKGVGPVLVPFSSVTKICSRTIITERVDRVEGLRDFGVDRYRFAAKASTPTRLVFRRKFIPASAR